MFPEDQLLPLSALQHWLYCPRQCALIHVEQAWAENRFTAEGRVLHEKAHDGPDETRDGIRFARGMAVRSLRLGLSGVCDVVEFHRAPAHATSPESRALPVITPVEYKRGKPKSHRADEVQLCAQAICIEEMLDLPPGTIPSGQLFYGKPRRRTDVILDHSLRSLTGDTAAAIHAMKDSGQTPLASYLPARCDACSLIDICQPKALRFKRGAQAWFFSHLNSSD